MESSNGQLTAAASMESLSSVHSALADNNVRTLFVSGLPMDAKPRELYLLFRGYHGYESSLLKMTAKNGKATSPVGFVTFATRQDADEARKALQGVRFDPECAQTIRLELARSNTKVPRPKQGTPPTSAVPVVSSAMMGLQQLPHFTGAQQHELLVDHMPMIDQHQLLALAMPHLAATQQLHMLPTATLQQLAASQPLFAAAAAQAQALQQQQAVAAQQAAVAQAAAAAQAAQASFFATASANAGPASASSLCSTLFVANLGAGSSEDELKSIFKSIPGFMRLRMHVKGGSAVAFVEYTDIRQATQAMISLQGFQLTSSDRGGLRIEYARNKMADING